MPKPRLKVEKTAKIFIAGHRGMVGNAIHRALQNAGFSNFILRTKSELDLRNQAEVASLFEKEKPEYVFLAAAKVGGIFANDTYRAEFLHDNLAIQTNVIHQSWKNGVKKLLFLGSSCIYPKLCPQPIKEEYLLTGELEPTNEPYAIAKIAGLKMCEAYHAQYGAAFITVMPTNLYGPNDNYHPQNAHVLPALIRKFIEAKESGASEVSIWGDGSPRREFMHVVDLAAACLHIMLNYSEAKPLNVGTGSDLSIKELAELIAGLSGFEGKLVFDPSKPNGTPRKLLDVSRLKAIGFEAKIGLEAGIREILKTRPF